MVLLSLRTAKKSVRLSVIKLHNFGKQITARDLELGRRFVILLLGFFAPSFDAHGTCHHVSLKG